MSNPWDPNQNRYKQIDEQADSLLDRIKQSKWTPFILVAFVICTIMFAYAIVS